MESELSCLPAMADDTPDTMEMSLCSLQLFLWVFVTVMRKVTDTLYPRATTNLPSTQGHSFPKLDLPLPSSTPKLLLGVLIQT